MVYLYTRRKLVKYIIPDYYKDFSCVGGDCPDTCCAGWQIVIDEKSKKGYRREKGIFGNRLKNEIDWKEGIFLQYEGRCAFLNDENLCDIYKEIGKDRLCRTCRLYPRHIEEFESLREVSLSLSCPIVAKLVLEKKEPVKFLYKEQEGEEEEYENFDYLLFTKLTDTREILLCIAQNRKIPMKQRIAMLLGLGHDIQRRIRNQELFSIDSLVKKYQSKKVMDFLKKKETEYQGYTRKRLEFAKNIFGLLGKLEIRKKEWGTWIRRAERKLNNMSTEDYKKGILEFRKVHWEKVEKQQHLEQIEEQIIVYFLFTYYCGAVYDENPYAKVKMAVLSLFAIEEMLFLEWFSSHQKMELSDWIGYAYQYSRELEHSDLNLNRMEKILSCKEEYGLKNFLYYIFS